MQDSNLCPKFEKAMEIISKRWTGLIIYQLQKSGPQRFGELENSISVSGRVLSDRLKDLEQSGLVKRDVYPETPVRIEYSLTDKGRALRPVFEKVEQWAADWVSLDKDTD